MEENENKEVVEETTQNVEESTETQEQESPISYNEDGDIKIDLTKIPTEDVQQETEPVNTNEEEVVQEETVQEEPTQEEVVEEEPEGDIEEPVGDVEEIEVPENVQKLMEFMEETGGDLDDYVRLNTNLEEMDDSEVLHDYYRKTKPHLDDSEINFLLEDNFSYNEDQDEERDIKRKKLALKEQVAEARSYLDGQKSKYYEDIKAGSKLTEEQQKAIEFFEQHSQNEERDLKIIKNQQKTFLNKTDKVFNKDFDGFEFDIDGKKMSYKVSNVNEIKKTQSDINNFVGKFLNDDALMEDAAGYHKSLFTAMNPDAIAKHFYEQGKSDAIKQTMSETKNINTSRESHKVYEGEGGIKFKVLGDDANDMKLRIKKRN